MFSGEPDNGAAKSRPFGKDARLFKDDPIALWKHIHGASAHFPIAMMMVSFAFDYGAILFRRPNWRTVGFWTLIVAAVLSVPTILSGLWGQLGWFGVDKWEATSVLVHRNVSLFGGGVVLLLAIWRSLRRDSREDLKGGEWITYLVALIFATAAIGYTGYLGAYVKEGY